jgi:hypothetical protein
MILQVARDSLHRTLIAHDLSLGEKWDLILHTIELLILLGSVFFLWRQISSSHEWNRRKTTHDMLSGLLNSRFTTIRRDLEKKIDPYDASETYSTKKAELTPEDKNSLKDILNYLEEMCAGIKHDIIDDAIAYDCCSGILRNYARWAKPFIQERRALHSLIWIEIEDRAKKWDDRYESLSLIRPGKKPLGKLLTLK